ncbi:hypothetical protein TTHERM_000562811 (macronuclear) [Tetrahymena thermophila SB210]|uniref:Uncharacterized protein n=1 Tax=Tetrahymena thermophila (strain SB210) TaxID=312017 RepID=W7XG51_TETTS|nr:hypothetical protein TTHERM_000562811 [Tetrahymena thermophila SB210]EWS75888.1 hypothetical protein TTHERM_000562811 [Tetrahymena thermophila SB210]|eukprot:XP_012651591.1 hypothetical protein TTHERM_000562811 [Tetrahymena thermophila SB210]
MNEEMDLQIDAKQTCPRLNVKLVQLNQPKMTIQALKIVLYPQLDGYSKQTSQRHLGILQIHNHRYFLPNQQIMRYIYTYSCTGIKKKPSVSLFKQHLQSRAEIFSSADYSSNLFLSIHIPQMTFRFFRIVQQDLNQGILC